MQAPFNGLPLTNKAAPGDKSDLNTPRKKNSGSDANILEAFAKDTGAAAEAVAKLLKNPSPDAAAAILEKLPSLLPEDPALAAVIAEEMAKQFGTVDTTRKGEITQEDADRIYEEMMSK